MLPPAEPLAALIRPVAVYVDRFEGPASLVVREIVPRDPMQGEVVVDVHAAGVNFPDLLVSKGIYQDLYPLPFIIGKEGAGVVCAVGLGVTSFAVGDRVAFHLDAGAFSERVVVPEMQCFAVPANVPLHDAAGMVLAHQTAYFALTDRGALKTGEWVLVLGASGGVGIASVQLARALGARVIAGINGPAKLDFVRAHGAENVIDLSAPDLPNHLRDRVRDITAHHGLDLVIDPTGGSAFDASLRALAPGGRLAVVGFTSGAIPSVKANYLLLKHISVIGVNWGVYREHDASRVARVQQQIFDLLSRGQIASPVTATFEMSAVSSALTALEQRATKGKVVLTTRHAI